MILPYYRRLIALRKELPVIAEGDVQAYALVAPPLDAAQREGSRSDFATPGYGPGFIGGFGAPGPNPRKWIK